MSTSKQYANAYVKKYLCVRGPLRECRSIRSGASGLPYYCAALVCVSEVIELLAVWRYYKTKTKNQKLDVCVAVWRHKPLVVNPVVVGPFEEEEEGTGIASDVVKVEGEDMDAPGYLRGDRVRLGRRRSQIVGASLLARSR